VPETQGSEEDSLSALTGVHFTRSPRRYHIEGISQDHTEPPNSKEGTTMKALSEQLSEMSVRAKRTEDLVAATRENNRAKLQAHHDALQESIAAQRDKAKQHASAASDSAHAQWDDARNSADQRFATLRARAEERRAERNAKKAQRHAERAEQDAAAAVDFALYVLDEAQYALVDAAIARAEADEPAPSS
jgi:vacuolar-type H+-ATPase subunit I/STV1